MSARVLTDRRDAVATITLDRPEKRNALSIELRGVLAGAWLRPQHAYELEHALRLRQAAEARKPREQLGHAGEARARRDTELEPVDHDGIPPACAVVAEVVACDASMQRLFGLLDVIAPSDLAVLVLGETGVGKEVFAREVHRRSARANRTLLVTVPAPQAARMSP